MVKFGTGGWRAIIGEEFTKENIQKLALAICLKMKAEGVEGQGVVMGYDRRFLSKEAIIWSCEIFGNQGIRVWFVNRSSPTPLVMFYVMKHELSYGMMVTASHNPAIYNGIKVFTYGGRDADEKQTAEIEYYLEQAEELYLPNEEENGQMPPPSYLELVRKGMVREINPMNEYLDNIISVINMDAIKERDLRIAIDPMYGVSLTALSTILSIARCTIETINSSTTPCSAERCRRPRSGLCGTSRIMCWTGIAISALPQTEMRTGWESLMTRGIISTQTTYWSCSITIC